MHQIADSSAKTAATKFIKSRLKTFLFSIAFELKSILEFFLLYSALYCISLKNIFLIDFGAV